MTTQGMRTAAAAGLAVAGIGLTGVAPAAEEAPTQACPAIGCGSGTIVYLSGLHKAAPKVRTVSLCMNSHCERVSATAGKVSVFAPVLQRDGPFKLAIIARDRHGHVVYTIHRRVSLQRFEPNGPKCGVCFDGRFTLDALDRRLIAKHGRVLSQGGAAR